MDCDDVSDITSVTGSIAGSEYRHTDSEIDQDFLEGTNIATGLLVRKNLYLCVMLLCDYHSPEISSLNCNIANFFLWNLDVCDFLQRNSKVVY